MSGHEPITLDEMRSLWPQTEDGRLCARLLNRFGVTKLIESALGGECTVERSQAEAGANKALAAACKDFLALSVPPTVKPDRKPMTKLHRFDSNPGEQPIQQP